MCGIVGFVGKGNVPKTLFEMLKCVEYRGYDSSGIATNENGDIVVKKNIGEVDRLKPLLDGYSKAKVGIGHTRWATHGGVTISNAHPHVSEDKNWAVVHNGIIENYMELKKQLEMENGVHFASETDTEVVAQLLQKYALKDTLSTIKEVTDGLRGSYALAIINKNKNGEIFVTKRSSPLYVALGKFGGYVASDPTCFSGFCKEYYVLEDNEFACVSDNKIVFYDKKLKEKVKKSKSVNFSKSNVSLKKYAHHMQKEILETDKMLERILHEYVTKEAFKVIDNDKLKGVQNVVLVGCGTAYHAGLMGERFIEKFAHISSRTYIASEFRYMDVVIPKNTLAILVSQSGETADTLGAMEVLRKRGVITIALTNLEYSTLAKSCDYVFSLFAGAEKAVASTKAYTAQIAILYLFSKYLNSVKHGGYHFQNCLEKAYPSIDYPKEYFMPLVEKIVKAKNVFFLGRDLDYITVTEASLKLKEISYINSSSYPAGELKHGFLALVDKDTLSIFLCTENSLLSKVLSNIHEVRARGGKTILITNLDVSIDAQKNVDEVIKIKSFADELMPITSIKFFQWLAYFTSTSLGINPDKPRNLAKSVTVE